MGARGKGADGDVVPDDQEVVATAAAAPVIAGYRPITDEMRALVNDNKAIEERVLRRFDELARLPPGSLDTRWFAIGLTHLQQAFMALNRAVMQPERIALSEDQPAAPEAA